MSTRNLRWTIIALTATACASSAPAIRDTTATPACEISAPDTAWLNTSLAAVREAALGLGGDIRLDQTEIIVFDASCTLIVAPTGERSFTAHDGMVSLPIGRTPAVITSFAAPSADPGGAYFVMALPSIWESAGFKSEISVHDFTLGVFAHEISHVWQLPTYFQSIRSVTGVERLPAPVDDDMVQRIFGEDVRFQRGVVAEIEAFRWAARQEDPEAVGRLAREALGQLRERWKTHFTGDYRALAEVQATFLTLEGSGQWFALRALTASPSGPRLEPDLALRAFGQRGAKWSQDLGLALAAVLDRLDPGWPSSVYGADDMSLIDLLDNALAQP